MFHVPGFIDAPIRSCNILAQSQSRTVQETDISKWDVRDFFSKSTWIKHLKHRVSLRSYLTLNVMCLNIYSTFSSARCCGAELKLLHPLPLPFCHLKWSSAKQTSSDLRRDWIKLDVWNHCRTFAMPQLGQIHLNRGGKFVKKLWCCVGGSITR